MNALTLAVPIGGILQPVIALLATGDQVSGDFLKQNWGNLASVVSLIFSFLTVIFSVRASQAAREARDSVLARTMEQEITDAYKSVSELATLVQIRQLQLAAIKCNELLDTPERLRVRWEHSLTTSSKNNWLLARQQLESIYEALRRTDTTELTATELESVHKACIDVRKIFVEEQSLVIRSRDKVVDNA